MLFIFPLITAIIGWFVAWLIVRILRRAVTKNRTAMAHTISKLSTTHFSSEALLDTIRDPAALLTVMPYIETHIDGYLRTRLQEKIPVIATFLGESTLKKLKDGLMEEIEALLPEVIGQYAGSLKSKIDIEAMVQRKLESLSDVEMNRLFDLMLGKAFLRVQWMGMVVGLLAGGIFTAALYLLQV